MKSLNKIDVLLIVRGILALSVLFWHIIGYKNSLPALFNIPGRTAVWIFFGISGYVMAYGFIKEKYTFELNSLKVFYQARFFRIFPLFLLISAISAFFILSKSGVFPLTKDNFLKEILMFQFSHSYILSGVFWTLGIEVQYYLVAPLLSFFIIRYANKKLIYLILTFFIFYLIVPFSTFFFKESLDNRTMFGNLSHFFIGMISCIIVIKKDFKIRSSIVFFFIMLLLISSNYLYHTKPSYYYLIGHLSIDGIIFLLIVLHHNLSASVIKDRFMLNKAFTWLGIISYGIYAWHPLVIENLPSNLKSFSIVLLLTLVLSFLSYFLYEEKIILWNRRKTKIA